MEQRIPPQNVEAEQAVLGAMLIDRSAVIAATENWMLKIFIGIHIGLFLKPW